MSDYKSILQSYNSDLQELVSMANELPDKIEGVQLNFEVIGSTTQPENPTENMIWVDTDKINSYYFSATQPENVVDYDVWFLVSTSSSIAFSVTKDNVTMVYPIVAQQYINGAWIYRTAKSWQNGKWMDLSAIPAFTYTGDYEIVNDADELITSSNDNWKIRFLTSGTLTFDALNGAESGIDVFCVGGGGGGGNGGGGGGYTNTARNVILTETTYEIVVGAGGSGTGGTSSAFGLLAAGGYPKGGTNNGCGGNGGSGGGSWSDSGAGKNGGSDGGNGSGSTSTYTGGKGQKNTAGPNGETGTTREFGEADATLYSGGGAGNGASGLGSGGSGGGGGKSGAAQANTGGGGAGGKGGSGIVIIRNKRG